MKGLGLLNSHLLLTNKVIDNINVTKDINCDLNSENN